MHLPRFRPVSGRTLWPARRRDDPCCLRGSSAQRAALAGQVSMAKYHGRMSRNVQTWCAAVVLCLCGMLAGCRKSTEALPKSRRAFDVRGKIVATDPEHSEITLQHDAIPGLMEAMTMP